MRYANTSYRYLSCDRILAFEVISAIAVSIVDQQIKYNLILNFHKNSTFL